MPRCPHAPLHTGKRKTRWASPASLLSMAAMRAIIAPAEITHHILCEYSVLSILYPPAVYRCSDAMPCAPSSISAISLSKAANVDSHWSRIVWFLLPSPRLHKSTTYRNGPHEPGSAMSDDIARHDARAIFRHAGKARHNIHKSPFIHNIRIVIIIEIFAQTETGTIGGPSMEVGVKHTVMTQRASTSQLYSER